MDTYYIELIENIRKYQEEIEQLNNELARLSSDTSEANRIAIARINGRITGREQIIKENQNIINNYDSAKAYSQRLKELSSQRENTNDAETIAGINTEIATINETLNNMGITADAIKKITEEHNQFNIFEEQQPPVQAEHAYIYKKDPVSITLEEQEKIAQEEYNRALDELLSIFDEEKNYFGEVHEFQTNAEIDAAYQQYMDMKIAAEKKRQDCLKKLNNIKSEIANSIPFTVEKLEQPAATSKKELIPVTDASKKELIPVTDVSKKELIPVTYTLKEELMPATDTSKEELIPITDNKKDLHVKRGYRRIIQDLTKGLHLGTKMGKRYTASNIKVAKSFKDELHSGNYLYNIVHVIPTIVKLPIQLIRKISANILLRAKDKENIHILEFRIQKLQEEDLETLFNEYIGGNIIQEHLPTIFNTLLNKKIQEYGQKKIDTINEQIKKNYIDVFEAAKQMDSIDKKMGDSKTSEIEKNELIQERKNLVEGKAKVVESILDDRAKVNRIYSSGMHGFSEDVRADSTGLSLTGKRFAKKNDLDNKLQERLANLEDAINKAIAEGRDEDALLAFTRMEMLYSENTKIEKSIFGNRSEGTKIFNPIQEEGLDYSADPFVRDLMTSITTTTAIIGAVNAIKTHIEADRMVDEYNKNIDSINAHNQEAIDAANKAGNDITDKTEIFSKGMESQSQQDILNTSNVLERDALNQVGWKLHGSDYAKYRGLDDANHEWYNNFYEQTKNALEDVASRRVNGSLSAQQALEEISKINSQTQDTMSGIVSDCLEIAKQYNPTVVYDNRSIEAVMEYMVQNPSAISDMNRAIVDVTNIGESLSGLRASQITSFQHLPNDIATTLIATASAGALSQSVSNNMESNNKQHKYGNEITDMVSEYIDAKRQDEEKLSRKK